MVSDLGGLQICVTGGCGFIGRHLIRALLNQSVRKIRAFDNLSVGQASSLPVDPRIELVVGDLRQPDQVQAALDGCDFIFHLAAPTDVRASLQNTRHDLDQGVLGTYHVLEASRKLGIKKLAFASSSCVYGSGLSLPVGEAAGPLLPASLYGASKLAAEGLIASFCHTFEMQSWLFRFPNVVGSEVTHGVILDFIRKLQKDPAVLPIFGDGRQTKTYLWAEDCIQGILSMISCLTGKVNVVNITTEGSTSVSQIAEVVISEMGLDGVEVQFSGGAQGWPGDVPYILLDGSKASQHGWSARLSSAESVRMTARSLLHHPLS